MEPAYTRHLLQPLSLVEVPSGQNIQEEVERRVYERATMPSARDTLPDTTAVMSLVTAEGTDRSFIFVGYARA